mgnify:FL=1
MRLLVSTTRIVLPILDTAFVLLNLASVSVYLLHLQVRPIACEVLV